MKTYSSKSNAKRAALKNTENPILVELSKGQWYGFSDTNEKLIWQCYGAINCPTCNIHLENGVTTYDDNKDNGGEALTHEFWCLGCDHGFGEEIEAATPTVHTGTGLKIEKNREERNGVKRPSIGGKCRIVWDYCDTYMKEHNTSPMPKHMKETALLQGWNENNAILEMYQWRKFNGLTKKSKTS